MATQAAVANTSSSLAMASSTGMVQVAPSALPPGILSLYDLWRKTTGSISLDIKRQGWAKRTAPPASAGPAGLLRVQPAPTGTRQARPRQPHGTYVQPRYYAPSPPGPQLTPAGDFASFAFGNTGARIKVLRHIEVGEKIEVTKSSGIVQTRATVDVAAGLTFDLDTAELAPVVRLKLLDLLSLHVLPHPAVKVQKRLALPFGDQGLGLRLSYECPLENIATPYRPPARLMVSLDTAPTNSVRLGTGGLEVDHAVQLGGGSTLLRGSGVVCVPREVPVVEGEPWLTWEIHRLGLKAKW